MKDYKTEEKILDRLEDLQNINQDISRFDEYSDSANKMIQSFYENSEDFPEELHETISTLKDRGFTDKEIHNLAKTLIKESSTYVNEARKTLKGIKGASDSIKSEIGELIMTDAKKEGLTQKSIHFKGYGTVTCKYITVPNIENAKDFITSLAEDDKLRDYISISKKAFRDKDIYSRKGISKNKELDVSIRSESKWA